MMALIAHSLRSTNGNIGLFDAINIPRDNARLVIGSMQFHCRLVADLRLTLFSLESRSSLPQSELSSTINSPPHSPNLR